MYVPCCGGHCTGALGGISPAARERKRERKDMMIE